jgi:hypothetical protein
MRKYIYVIIAVIIYSFTKANAHGFGAHAAHLSKIIALNDQYKTLLEDPRYQPYFVYGSIFPDIQYATNFKPGLQNLYSKIRQIKLPLISQIGIDVAAFDGLTYEIQLDQIPDQSVAKYPFGIDTHDDKYGMAFAEYLLNQCDPIDPPGPNPGSNGTTNAHDARNMKLAFALGYYAHLAEDVAAHNFLVPKLTAALNLGDIELAKTSQSFAEDPNSQTEGIIEGIIDHYYGANSQIADVVFNQVWVARSQFEPTITQMDFNTGYAHLLYNGPTPTYYDAQGGWGDMNPVLLFFDAVLNDWYTNNPNNLPPTYKQSNSPMSTTGIRQLATVFRFVNRFYPAVVGHPFNGKDRLDQVLSDWVANHLDLSDEAVAAGLITSTATLGVAGLFAALEVRVNYLAGLAYPAILKDFSKDLSSDARTLVALMLSDLTEADNIVSNNSSKINISEYNRLKNSILFTNPTSVLDSYWNEYSNLGTTIYKEVGPDGKWYSDWSPWHSQTMAWSAINSLNNSMPSIYATNPNIGIYDAYFEVGGRRITGPEPASTFQNYSTAKVVFEIFNTSDVANEDLSLKIRKDHASNNYNSDVEIISSNFSMDQNPLNYNTVARNKLSQTFSIGYNDLANSNSRGYYLEVRKSSTNKSLFTTNFEQYQSQLNLTPNYIKLYGTYESGKWPISLGLSQALATTTLNSMQFIDEVTSGGYYKINGSQQSSISLPIGSYVNLEAIPPAGNYYFISWSDGNTANPRNYLVQSTTGLTAIYKKSLASNSDNAFKQSSQRKFYKSFYGTMYLVYESGGKVWYEYSTNDGVTWKLGNMNQPLSSNSSKLPSIGSEASVNDGIIIVYQEQTPGNYYKIVAKEFQYDTQLGSTSVDENMVHSYSENANPVISTAYGYTLVMWEVDEYIDEFFPNGIYYKFGILNGVNHQFSWQTEGILEGTSGISNTPTISSGGDWDTIRFALAYEENNSIYFKRIKYRYQTEDLTFSTSVNLSYGNGYTHNFAPSIIAVGSGARISWIGKRFIQDEEGLQKSQAEGGHWENRAIFRDGDANGPFWNFGNYVNNATINRGMTNGGYGVNSYVVGWSQSSGTPNQYTRNTSLSQIIDVRDIGGNILSGGFLQFTEAIANTSTEAFQKMKAASFNNATTPKNFFMSKTVAQLGKESFSSNVSTGREGVITIDSGSFYFAFGDILVNDEQIQFEEIPDTITHISIETINKYLTTKSFTLNSNSQFYYGVQYGFSDSINCSNSLNGNRFIKFKVLLVDNANEEILGTFDEVVFENSNVYQHNNLAYQVNTNGIGNRVVKLKLKAEISDSGLFAISNKAANLSSLGMEKNSKKLKQINYNGALAVKEYSLSQNYPNPFNPVTTINYALPKSGNVVLKVYDILGKEVATLVNNHQETGRYSVQFDGSKIASGMYIYKLTSGSFSEIKKMMLVK